MTDAQREGGWGRSGTAAWLVAAAILCWAVAGFGLFQMALIAGNEAVEAEFGQSSATPGGVYVAGIAGSLALAVAFVLCAVMAGRRSRPGARTPYLLAGGGLGALGLMVGAMAVQQLTLTGTMADAADVGASTSFAQGMVAAAAVLLLVGAVAAGVTGLLRRSRG